MLLRLHVYWACARSSPSTAPLSIGSRSRGMSTTVVVKVFTGAVQGVQTLTGDALAAARSATEIALKSLADFQPAPLTYGIVDDAAMLA